MRSGTVDAMEPLKFESRQSGNRRKMAKNTGVVNGAEVPLNYAADPESVVRQVYHDHISCTKTPFSKSDCPKGGNLPCETDHIYAICNEVKKRTNPATAPSEKQELEAENKNLSEVVLVQLDVIQRLKEQLEIRDRKINILTKDNNKLKARKRRDRRMCLWRKNYRPKSSDSTDSQTDVASEGIRDPPVRVLSAPLLATRYFGRKSRTVPSRALKRRYLGPPKFPPNMKPTAVPPTPTESGSPKISLPPIVRKADRCHKGKKRKMDYLTTDSEYFLPDYCAPSPKIPITASDINVPSWRYKPVSSYYQMEGTENINDPVFDRRHAKYEQDERRRKRWDMQRLRELKVSEKLLKGTHGQENERLHKAHSFYPNSKHIEYIEVTEQLPVLAFGTVIPLFQPCEFSLPWVIEEEAQRKGRGKQIAKVT